MLIVDIDSPLLNVYDTGELILPLEVGQTIIEPRCGLQGWGPWLVLAIVADLVLVRRPGKVKG